MNDKFPRTVDLRDGDLPDWNLGLNFEVELLSPTKFDQLILFLCQTAAETQREFVVGGCGPKAQSAEDWGFIGTHLEPLDFPHSGRHF